MKRYDLITNYRCGSAVEEMEPADDGEWVRYEEVAAVIAGYEQRMRLIHWWASPERSLAASPVSRGDQDPI